MFLYSEKELDEYEKYIKNNFGDYNEVIHEIVSPDIHLDIIVIPPTDKENYYKLIAMGMGAYRMNVPKNLKKYELEHAELIMYIPPTWNIKSNKEEDYWPIRQLKIIARLPINCDTWIGHGHTVSSNNENTPYATNTDFCSMLIVYALDYNCQNLNFGMKTKGKINFYQLFPLYKDELEYKQTYGQEKLFELFDEEDLLQIININRKNNCKKTK